MQTFQQAINDGFEAKEPGYYSYVFGKNKEYELAFEPLLFEDQFYVALYRDGELLTNKVVIKPGKEIKDDYKI